MSEASKYFHMEPDEVAIFNSLERMGATLSLIGVSSIFVTFGLFKRMRTIPNTFIFFASIANVGACVACLIGYDGIEAFLKDNDAPLCKAQGFLFEWFMQSDPWWSFAMAVNVFMVFFMSFNPSSFRKKLWIYCIICYGLPAIPAFTFLLYRVPDKPPFYGDAALWCWINSDQWNNLRIFSYYMPIWICAFLSAVIYVAVGYHVFHQRNQLRNLSLSNPAKEATGGSSGDRDSAEKNLTANSYGTVTTEVQVTSAAAPGDPFTSSSRPSTHHTNNNTTRRMSEVTTLPPSPGHANLSTVAGMSPSVSPITPGHHHTSSKLAPVQVHNYPWSREPSSFATVGEDVDNAPTLVRNASDSTYGFPSTGPTNFGSSHHASISAAPPTTPTYHSRHKSGTSKQVHVATSKNTKTSIRTKITNDWQRFCSKLRHMDPVKLAYLRTSFVFAISVLVTWTPSSINRIYSLSRPLDFNYNLNLAAAIVLPLQGVWNAVIYFSTSWRIVREEWRRVAGHNRTLQRWGLVARGYGPGSGARLSSSGGAGGLRSEMGRNRRLEEDEMELRQSPVHSSHHLSPRSPRITGQVRVVKGKGLDDDFSLA